MDAARTKKNWKAAQREIEAAMSPVSLCSLGPNRLWVACTNDNYCITGSSNVSDLKGFPQAPKDGRIKGRLPPAALSHSPY